MRRPQMRSPMMRWMMRHQTAPACRHRQNGAAAVAFCSVSSVSFGREDSRQEENRFEENLKRERKLTFNECAVC